ncbi:MAG: NAD(P)-dependent oxidoreductase [Betaproteobacteria bacterium]|nr:NAD(P)-dependent oxidoreductase [Betaproteobacteria bacterium]
MDKGVGMIGLGIMGSAMSANLLKAGFQVQGYDVVPARRAALRKSGGMPRATLAALAARCEIMVSSLPSVAALAAVAGELAAAARRGSIVVETSTLPIEVKEAARARLAKAGVVLLDCPLSGTGAQARVKDLVVYASGPLAAYRRCRDVFDGFARAHRHVGVFGNGSRMKFVANLLVAIHNVAAAEAFTLARKAGLDAELVYRTVADGAGGSRMFQVRGPMMVANDYSDATMKVEVWQKDMQIIGEFARKLDCPTPLLSASAPIYNAAMAQGHGMDDTGSVCAVLGRMAGVPQAAKRRRARR